MGTLSSLALVESNVEQIGGRASAAGAGALVI